MEGRVDMESNLRRAWDKGWTWDRTWDGLGDKGEYVVATGKEGEAPASPEEAHGGPQSAAPAGRAPEAQHLTLAQLVHGHDICNAHKEYDIRTFGTYCLVM